MEKFFIFCFLKQKYPSPTSWVLVHCSWTLFELIWGLCCHFWHMYVSKLICSLENVFTTIVSWRGHDDKSYISYVCIKVMCSNVTLACPCMIWVTCVGLGFISQKPILPPPRQEHIYFWGCFYTKISLNVISGSQPPFLGYVKMSIDNMVCNGSNANSKEFWGSLLGFWVYKNQKSSHQCEMVWNSLQRTSQTFHLQSPIRFVEKHTLYM